MNDVGREIGKDSLDPIHTAQRNPNIRITGQRHRGKPMHMRTLLDARNISVRGRRRDHHHLIPTLLQMLQHPQYRVGYPIHQWQE
ncbi:hypothetical protein GCM10010052_13780 [Paenarthrobacter histidinolovorans]|nr:hypothetical protein GCM10010052_13780 [Paenarthrobacter histidinolovorans]